MSSFLSKFKSGATNAVATNAHNASKRDPNAPQPTSLERLLAHAGPPRHDGSDKLYGMENFGSTCYYNSIIQCLYHSTSFREHILNFPAPTPFPESTIIDSSSIPVETTASDIPLTPALNAFLPSLSPSKAKSSGLVSPTTTAPKKPTGPITTQTSALGKDENKDSPEYKKKMALAAGPIVRMDQASGTKYGMPESMFTSLKDMFEAVIHYDSRTGIISPRRGTELVRSLNHVFSVPMHQDAHECLNFVLNEIVEDLEKYAKQISQQNSDVESNGKSDESIDGLAEPIPPNTRWIHDLFEGTMTSETKCLTCQNTSAREEAYLDISVDLGLYSSVTSCLLKFSEEEMLNERNKFHCDSCNGLQEAEKRMKIKRLPRILALHLKRFTYTEDLQRLQKLHHRVAYPYYLRLLNLTDDAEDQDKLYELYAIVVHIGMSPYQGHYVSIIKTSDWGWLLFDDENVEPIDKGFVRNFFGSDQGLACAYVLFYKETTFEAAERDMDTEDRATVSHPLNLGLRDVKLNGAGANGLHAVNSSPTAEDAEFAHLDRAFTAPLTPTATVMNGTTAFSNPLEHVTSSPVLPFLSRKKSAMLGTISFDRDDREKKVSEKESQRQLKEKKRDGSVLHRWQSKNSMQKEDSRIPRTSLSTDSRNSQTHEEPAKHNLELAPREEPRTSFGDASKDNSSNGFFASGMHRFKQTSKSIKGRPKLWPPGRSKGELSQHTAPVQPALKPMTEEYDHPPPIPPPQLFPSGQTPLASQAAQGSEIPPQLPPRANPQLNHLDFSNPAHQDTATTATTFLFHAVTTPEAPSPHEQPLDSSLIATPPIRPDMPRTPTPTALPPFEPPSTSKKKAKRSYFGIGRKKSVAGS